MATATPTTTPWSARPIRAFWRHFIRDSTYGIAGLPLSILWITVFVPLVAVSGPLMVVGAGFAILAFTLRVATSAAGVERWLLREILQVDIADPIHLQSHRSPLLSPIEDPTRWRALGFLCIRMVTGMLHASVVMVVWLFPIFQLVAFILVVTGQVPFTDLAIPVGIGLFFIALGPLLIGGLAKSHAAIARALLGPGREQLIVEADLAVRNRDLSVEAAEAERRRIERDLHDGAQARLATVALDLGRAKRKLEHEEADPEVAAIIDHAHSDAKAAIVELRNLARGIHPAVLTDRGLDAALSEVAARCTVPVHLDVRLQARPPAHIESAAYFAVSELVANISKHSKASHAWVTVRGNDDAVYLDISDDGIGGADPTIGSGLDGLHDRITGLGGDFSVRSPLGGGTATMIELPLNYDRR